MIETDSEFIQRLSDNNYAMIQQLARTLPADVEDYIRSLKWSPAASDWEKTLVAGNLRTFAAWVRSGKQDIEG